MDSEPKKKKKGKGKKKHKKNKDREASNSKNFFQQNIKKRLSLFFRCHQLRRPFYSN